MPDAQQAIPMFITDKPALVLAPMDGLTDAPMRAVQGEIGAFTYAVSEFERVSADVISKKAILRNVPELLTGGTTSNGLPVQVQLLGGDPERMALSALVAVECGAQAIDINFGCPAPTVNRHDGGATLLKHPERIRALVKAMRDAVPAHIPVSAKLRLGWDNIDSIYENAAMAAEGGANWLTIHARTRVQGYRPPVYWQPIGKVREQVGVPVVANGDIWSIDDFRRCREETGCIHYMLGRGALADPYLTHRVANELGLRDDDDVPIADENFDWVPYLQLLVDYTAGIQGPAPGKVICRLKQWLSIAHLYGRFPHFDLIKRTQTVEELFELLDGLKTPQRDRILCAV
jgi:tRNA-dihydrouridine synthase C